MQRMICLMHMTRRDNLLGVYCSNAIYKPSFVLWRWMKYGWIVRAWMWCSVVPVSILLGLVMWTELCLMLTCLYYFLSHLKRLTRCTILIQDGATVKTLPLEIMNTEEIQAFLWNVVWSKKLIFNPSYCRKLTNCFWILLYSFVW